MSSTYRYQIPVEQTQWKFEEIVPTVKDIGLWGRRVQKAYADLGVLDFAWIDADALLDNDARVAEELDACRRGPG